MANAVQVVIDCADPASLAAFWAEALRYEVQAPPPGFDSWPAFLEAQGIPRERWNDASAIVDPDASGPRVYFQRVPEPKQTKNRVHVDVIVTTRGTPHDEIVRIVADEVQRLVGLGATVVEEGRSGLGSYWSVLQDPEGNEFCVA